ncbi:MAG TPA: hypothetical protein VNU95_08600 [Candidatus Acidoferrales bacterium]|jgi:hypothetical protein|nr:hypothetical protein [Candidatus Acidoferrales bacterium]
MKFLLAIAMIAFALQIFAQDIYTNNIYTNGVIGVSVEKDSGWEFMPETERQSAVLSTTEDHAGLKAYILAHMSKPFVIITKPRQTPPQPTITALLAPLDSNTSTNPVEVLQQMTASGPRAFNDYHVAVQPHIVEISGKNGAYCKATYTLYLRNGDQVPVSFETWYIIRGNYYFLIGIVSRQPEDEDTAKEIKEMMASLKIGDVKNN